MLHTPPSGSKLTGNDESVPEPHGDRLEELVDLRVDARVVPVVRTQRLA